MAPAAAGGGTAVADRDGFGPITVTPGTPRYVDLVRGFNQRWVGTPDFVIVAGSTEQVVDAVQDAVRAGKRLTVRSGGHCYRDFVYNPDVRVVVDVSQMKDIAYDPDRRAIAIGSGATVIEVDHALYERWGVALPGGSCPTVGYGGHIAGGGFGPLSRPLGLTVDHLHAVEVVVVDADGHARAVVATSDPSDPNHDLWWAHTGGGGGNFGIVTRYWFRTPGATGDDPGRLLPSPPAEILESSVSWPWSQITQQGFQTLLANWGSWHAANSAPTSPFASVFSHLLPANHTGGTISMVTQIDSAVPNAQQILDDFVTAIATGVGATLSVAERRPLPWLHSTEWPGFFAGYPTFRAEQKSAFMLAPLPEPQVDAMYRNLTLPDYTWPQALVEMASYGGRVSAVAPDATAMPHRHAVMLLMPLVFWNDAADDVRNIAWARQIYHDMYADTGGVPVPNAVTDGCYVNYADTDLNDPTFNKSGVTWQQLYYKDNYPRLQQVKARWDPTNFFHHGQSVSAPGK